MTRFFNSSGSVAPGSRRATHGRIACRSCGSASLSLFVDLGAMPLANSFLTTADEPEQRFPLVVNVCAECFLVQTQDCVDASSIFSDYAYFSSYSDSWLRHAREYSEFVVNRFGLGRESLVIEVASNDGYLLRNFVRLGIPCLGVEPAANVAAVARRAGIRTESAFFGSTFGGDLAKRGLSADLMIANNVLAHVPDINDFLAGFRAALNSDGIATFEFPHLLNLIREVQFDTIYHEHFSYLSLLAVEGCLERNGLAAFDIEELATHGGSLRLYVQRIDCGKRPRAAALGDIRRKEASAGLAMMATYRSFAPRVEHVRAKLRQFFRQSRSDGKSVVAYGAAAKGNTLLNYCGTTKDDVAFCVDRSLQKQGRFLPGSRIPIYAIEEIDRKRPDFVLILPWNLKEEIVKGLAHIEKWGGRFVVAIPELKVL